jgi:phosphoribosyl 1,2-cyclic phosphodiesterase
VKVTFWGVRGSLPTPGPATAGYGGNTACVSVEAATGSLVVLDAGTGIRELGDQLPAELTRVDVLLTHLHMDHIIGLGFFAGLYRPGLEVHLWGPASTVGTLRERLSRYLSPPLFPVLLRELPCRLSVHDVSFEPFALPGCTVTATLVCHPGATVGYRLSDARSSLAYLPDHEPVLANPRFAEEPRWSSGAALAEGVDLLVHDAQYTDDEYDRHVGWGHSSLGQAFALARALGTGRFVPFHFDPSHDDAMLDGLFAMLPPADGPMVVPAREGLTLTV